MDEARIARRGLGPRLWLAGGWLLLALLAAIFAPLVAPQDPLAQDLMLERLPPFWMSGAESGYWLGTDSLGRDLLSRLIFGGRIAFIVAFAAAIAACLVGSTLGLVAGYFGGWADRIISRIVDVWMAFPPVLFAILLVAVLGTGLSSVILAIVIIDWTRFCRVIRAEAMGQSRMDYVENARIAGYGRIGIMLREVLPNVVPSIVALLSLEMGRRHRGGHPVLRQSVDLDRRSDLGRHHRRGPAVDPSGLVGAGVSACHADPHRAVVQPVR